VTKALRISLFARKGAKFFLVTICCFWKWNK